MKYYFTSEAVTEGHPDKVCDKISDKILDEALKVDANSHVAVETTIKDDLIFIYGEISSKAKLDYEKIVKDVLKDIGYTDEFRIMTKISKQSTEINEAVSKNEICAGDQGIMFGYACRETDELMPLPISLANKLAYKLSMVRKEDKNSILLPDGKTQVTVEYLDGVPKRIDTVIIASQHKKEATRKDVENYVMDKVILEVLPKDLCDSRTKYLINTSGSFVIGGPVADSGTTGRKIVCDTYGGMGRIGGGALSSKDPSKVDRSAAYYARFVAKNIVAHNLADKCEVQVAYAIGYNQPISVFIETFGTNKTNLDEIDKFVRDNFDFSVDNIIHELDLKRPIYYDLACYGHFGRNGYSWEKIKEIKK